MIKPFLKWVGGKKQLVNEIKARLPEDYSKRIHIEPFIGGGSVLFSLQPDRAYICDFNSNLIKTYFAVCFDTDNLLSKVLRLSNTQEDYYILRLEYNMHEELLKDDTDIAALFMYLNKTGFNGMYRVNADGLVNVPWGHNPHESMEHFINERDIRDTAKYLFDHVTIGLPRSYDETWEHFKNADGEQFWYLDPPYAPLDKDLERGNFDQYTTFKGWAHDEQVNLRDMCIELDKAGHKFMLSNASCTLIKELYKDFNIAEVDARRSISAKASTRKGCKEVIITNY